MSEPVRTCVACRTRRPQRELVRVRRRSDGQVVPAVGRHTRGRHAYLCPDRACFTKAHKRRALPRALQGRGASVTVHNPEPDALWPQVLGALDHELTNMQRSGDHSRSPRYDALQQLRQGLREPGRSA